MFSRVCLSLILLTAALAQEPSFKAGVSLVEIDAEVITKRGVIEGLERADFQIKDDDEPVSVRYCVWEQTPLDIVFVFDLGTATATKLDKLRIAAEAAMAELREGDRVSTASFDERFRVELPLSSDLKEFKQRTRIGLAQATFGNSFPSLLNAATEAATYLSGQAGPNQRRAILMFTADIGSGKKESHIGAAKVFWESDALLSAMVVPNSLTRFTHDDNPLHFGDVQMLGFLMKFSAFDSIDELAALTGGEVVYAESTGNATGSLYPNAALGEVMRRMRQRYRLYYDRPTGKPGQTRRVDVGLSASAAALYPDARIIARKGYMMPKGVSAP
jgi:hypothetical protein